MSRTRTSTLGAAAALLAAGAMVTTAQSARADWTENLACRPTAPTHTVGAGPYGAEWISNGVLVGPVYTSGRLLVNCLYVGDRYRFVAGTTTSLGASVADASGLASAPSTRCCLS